MPHAPRATLSVARRDVGRGDALDGKRDRRARCEQVCRPGMIKFRASTEREISAFVYRPDAGKFPGPRPVIINIHGGPEGQSRPDFLGRSNYYLDELGCVLVFPNVRGSAGYGKTFLTLNNGMKHEKTPVRDIGALLDWIGKQPGLDAARVAVSEGATAATSSSPASRTSATGCSAASTWSGSRTPSLPQEHAGLPPRLAPRGIWRRTRSRDGGVSREDLATEQRGEDRATALRRPGKNDPRVPVTRRNKWSRRCATVIVLGTSWPRMKATKHQEKERRLSVPRADSLSARTPLKPAPAKTAGFGFDDWLIVPLRVHLISSTETPALHTTLTEQDLARILPKMNRVWAQAGIQFRIESLVREEALPLENADVERREELPARMPRESRSSTAFNVYYVKKLDVNGFYMPRGIFVDTAALRSVEGGIDEPIPHVTSHELGHALSLPHRQDRTNLMASGTTGTLLNEDAEIQSARKAAKNFTWSSQHRRCSSARKNCARRAERETQRRSSKCSPHYQLRSRSHEFLGIPFDANVERPPMPVWPAEVWLWRQMQMAPGAATILTR